MLSALVERIAGFDPGFAAPLPSGKNNVGRGWLGAGTHAGFDIAVAEGTEVFAVGGGEVTHASSTGQGDLGIFCAVRHDNGMVTRYLHFSELLVAVGQSVSRGQLIGKSGNTGNSSGPHLHIDIKVVDDATLAKVVAVAGTPSTGFEGDVTGFGQGIPPEPWIPVDQYSDNALQTAREFGIPLYDEIPHRAGLVKLGLLGLGLLGLFVLAKRL